MIICRRVVRSMPSEDDYESAGTGGVSSPQAGMAEFVTWPWRHAPTVRAFSLKPSNLIVVIIGPHQRAVLAEPKTAQGYQATFFRVFIFAQMRSLVVPMGMQFRTAALLRRVVSAYDGLDGDLGCIFRTIC
jgi:hypothetical protein